MLKKATGTETKELLDAPHQSQESTSNHGYSYQGDMARKYLSYDVERLGGQRGYDDFRFEAFRATPKNSEAVEALKLFNPGKENVFLWGPAGTGKSHLATAAARLHKKARVIRCIDLLKKSRQAARSDNPYKIDEFEDEFSKISPLVIDDMGAEKDTEFSVSTLLSIVDRRWMGKVNGLIVTSNLSPDDLSGKLGDDRIMSRIYGMSKVFKIDGPDHRISNDETKK